MLRRFRDWAQSGDLIVACVLVAVGSAFLSRGLRHWGTVVWAAETGFPRSPVAYGVQLRDWADLVTRDSLKGEWYLVVSEENAAVSCRATARGGERGELLSSVRLVVAHRGVKSEPRRSNCRVRAGAEAFSAMAIVGAPTPQGAATESLGDGFAFLDSAFKVVYSSRAIGDIRRLPKVVEMMGGTFSLATGVSSDQADSGRAAVRSR
jgi:hypothetical protein